MSLRPDCRTRCSPKPTAESTLPDFGTHVVAFEIERTHAEIVRMGVRAFAQKTQFFGRPHPNELVAAYHPHYVVTEATLLKVFVLPLGRYYHEFILEEPATDRHRKPE